MSKFKIMTKPNVGKMWSNYNLYTSHFYLHAILKNVALVI